MSKKQTFFTMRKLYFLLFALFFYFVGKTQVSTYTFSNSTVTYTALTTPTTVHASGWDDAVTSVTIPFTFKFNGINYTSCNVATNGFITFGATAPATTLYTPISGATAYGGAIAAFGRDLISNASTIVYGTTGTAPNRIFVVQWNNARRYNAGAVTGDVLNFQIRLVETSNVVQIDYGTNTATSTTALTCQVGLRGSANTDFNNRTATTSWTTTTAGTLNTSTLTSSNTVMPAGRRYTWTPSSCSGTPNAGTIAASVNNVCSSTSTTLTASGLTGGNGISYQWQSSTNNSTWSNIAGQTATTYATTLPLGSMYYRITTTCSNSALSNNAPSVQLTGTSCIILPSNSTTTTNTGCSGTVYDPGATGNYGNSQTGTITLYPAVSTDKVRLTFTSFSTESGYDGLVIYNGNSTSAPIISSGLAAGISATNCPAGSYYGTTSPGTVTSTAADGSLTLVFRSDGSTVSTGFVATLSCFSPPAPSCATLTSPLDGSTGVTVAPTLTWSSVQYAESYDVYFGTTLPATPTVNVTSPSYTPPSLSPLTTYQWKIVPKNATGSATGCSTWSFTTMSPQYATTWISMNTGSSNWCVGETRNITVTIKNNGSSDWNDAVADFNIGVKWNGDADYFSRVDAQNLAAGQTQTFTLTITAPSTTGSNNLTFDVTREGCFWFGTNITNCGVTAGPGNIAYVSSSISINSYPTLPNAGNDVSICVGQSTQLQGSATGPTGTLHTANSDWSAFTTNANTMWLISSTNLAGGTSSELNFTWVSSVTGQYWIRGPLLNATQYSTLSFSFKHYVDWYTGSFVLRLQTSPDGTTWTDRWSTTCTADIAATTQTVNLNTLAGTNFYYRFVFDGYTWNVNDWYVDDIQITGNMPVTYAWSSSTGLSSTTISNPIANPTQTTTYTMSASSNGCAVSDQVIVTVNRPDVATVNSLIDPDVSNGDYLWNGLTSTSWNLASNWYQYVSSSNSFETTTVNPVSTSIVYILPSAVLGSCVSTPPTLDVVDNISGLEVASGITLTLPNNLNVTGNVDISGTLSGNGSITLNGTSNQTIASVPTIPNLIVNKTAGTVILSTPIKVNGVLTMTNGNIQTTASNILEIGTDETTVGTINWTNGSILGPLKRWFATAINSTQTSGIFPVGANIPGKGITNRYAQVNFSSAPSVGGYIIAEYELGMPSNNYAGLPLSYNSGSYPQAIQNAEEEGYWDITPYDASNAAYGALNSTPYSLKVRLQNPSTLTTGWTTNPTGNMLYDPSTIRLIRSKGSTNHTTWELAGTHVLSSGTAGDYFITSNNITQFSWFNGGGNNQNPLPVELLYFEGTKYPTFNMLKWATASEHNSAYFDLERSTDGENWRVVGTKSAAGNSNEKINYSYLDPIDQFTFHYYRLVQYDMDGKFKVYGPIILDNSNGIQRVVKYVNSLGQEVGADAKGVVFEIFEDGTSKKTIR